tara:strand:- start:37 stop:318 length:282 start_codon:yes stop_codon:yes gene_type:complete
MKLKDIIKESNVWDRKFGEPLPTLADTTAKHLKEAEGTEADELLDNVMETMEETLYEWGMEAKRIGGDYAENDIKQQILKQVETMLSDWEKQQ